MKKIGFVAGAFDLLHAGHILMLEQAKTQCDYLIVGLQSDPSIDRPEKNKPIESLYERWIRLRGCKYVDEVIPYTTEAEILHILQTQSIDVRILGEDYIEKDDFTGLAYCNEMGIEIYYNDRRHNFSTSELRKRIANA